MILTVLKMLPLTPAVTGQGSSVKRILPARGGGEGGGENVTISPAPGNVILFITLCFLRIFILSVSMFETVHICVDV